LNARCYRLKAPIGISGLRLQREVWPKPKSHQVLLRVRAVSLNARDIMVVHGQLTGQKEFVIPVSDGAGEVVEVGPEVTRFRPGDRVVAAFRQAWVYGPLVAGMNETDLGGRTDGMLSEYVILDETGLVQLPTSLTLSAAATLPCAGVTAWGALMGATAPKPGSTVLVQGTGGVSLFALQIARAAGVRVLAITSTDAKAQQLRLLGSEIAFNYITEPNWDRSVLDATGGCGVDKIIEVGGPGTLERSMRCIRHGGEIAFIGLLDNPGQSISPLPLLAKAATLRGVSAGSRADLESLIAAVVTNQITPIIDSQFPFEEVPIAFERLERRKHVGKIVITI
jgi:NADPH:quinone reductase-like Zn-dependent oxidoreductase